jgi:hypothetical protein
MEPLRRWDPEQIGGFVLAGRLGAGAMGQVYLGRSAAGRLVAVKTIKIELAEEPDFRARFAQEVAAARRVSGAFTAAVVAADPEADVPWLATAYVPAPSLSGLVRACGPLPVPAVRWLAAGCAEALASIHGAGLVHRDLKPSNVLVSPDGPRVIDFGLARAAERIQLTVTRGAVGTPAYMAPEQARDTRQATTASDVFSLGATMLFAATGHAPYQGETVIDVLVRLATEPPDLTGLDGDLADVVVACLERDPRKRPTSASVLAQLAPGLSPEAGASELGPSSLPGQALALISEYRQGPRPSAEAGGGTGEDATFGSQPAVSQPSGPVGRRLALRRGTAARLQRAGRAPAGGGTGPGRQRGRPVLIAVASVAAVALLAAGVVIGDSISSSAPPPPFPPPALGAAFPGQSPGSTLSTQAGRPHLVISQDHGDGYTVFVIYGQGWPPGRPVTVSLTGVGASPERPIADSLGTFSYAINQNHEFYPGGLPLGTYHVLVTGANGKRATARFVVNHVFQAPPGPS